MRASAKSKGRCALCTPSFAGSRLCEDCARDPANADWIQGEELLADDVTELVALPPEVVAANLSTVPRKLTRLQEAIVRMHAQGAVVTIRCYARTGGVMKVRRRWRSVSYREIARSLGCSEAMVRKTVSRTLKW